MKRLITLVVALALLACQAAGAEAQESWMSKDITITFEEHVANVEDQAPQVYGVAQAFMEKYPNVKIELVGNSEDTYATKMKLAAQSNTLPDIFWLSYSDGVEFMNSGYLAELTDAFADAPELIDTFLPDVYGVLSSQEGGVYGISCEMQCDCYWLNKALFDKCGLELPKTYGDMLACAKVFKENGIVPLAMGTSASLGTWMIREAIWYYDLGEIYPRVMNGEEKWENDAFMAYYDNWAKAREAGLLPESSVTLDYYSAREQFLTGQAAMFGSGTWDTAQIEGSAIASDAYFWWGPSYEGAPVTQQLQMLTAGNPYVVSKRTQDGDPDVYAATIAFLKFYYGAEGSAVVVSKNCIPVTKFAGEVDESATPVFARVVKEMATATNALKKSAKSYIASAVYSAFEESFLGVFNGVYTPQEACQMMDTQIEMYNLTK